MSMMDDFDRAKVGYYKMKEHDKAIWNDAIECHCCKAKVK